MLDPSPVATPRFVGRDREMAALRGALARPPAIVLVEGEAGIGKSRLLREWLAAPEERTALVSVCPPLRESLTRYRRPEEWTPARSRATLRTAGRPAVRPWCSSGVVSRYHAG